ncbi:MAG TPA: hypothetical protein PKA64_24390, partial [Myxococcota bacterium]|nr:hypothetical protein [Myxococcota bacterium]
MSTYLALLWAACTGPVDVGQRPPPGWAVVGVGILIEGEVGEVSFASTLGPGVGVGFVGGLPGAGPCPRALGGACLGVTHPYELGRSVTNAAGAAAVRFVVPRTYGRSIGLQAIVNAPGGPRTTNVAVGAVWAAAGDQDDDGLPNGDELRHGADPRYPDTDGGGVTDGQEVRLDGTDPADPTDDVGVERVCGDGRDNDGDLSPDCFDLDCLCVETCGNGRDDDHDHLIDCDDPDCPCVEDCGDGRDDDRDLRVDCDDPDCACVESCVDGEDLDRDGLSGAADPDCAGGEVCGNGRDDDGDGLVDCEDAACVDLCAEDCGNGVDDNGDLWVDCEDEACWTAPGCEPDEVVAWVRSGALSVHVGDWSDIGSSCWGGHGRTANGTAEDVVGSVRVARGGRVETCEWRVDEVTRRWSSNVVHAPAFVTTSYGSVWTWGCDTRDVGQDQLDRAGFRVGEGCGLAGSSFLPARWTAEVAAEGPRVPYGWGSLFAGRARATLPDGRAWYDGRAGVASGSSSPGGGGWGDWRVSCDAVTAPLGPTAAYGACATGAPTLVTDAAVGP